MEFARVWKPLLLWALMIRKRLEANSYSGESMCSARRTWLGRLCVAGALLMVVTGIGTVVMFMVTVGVVLPAVGSGIVSMTLGAISEADNVLRNGDSEQRLAILNQFKQAIDASSLSMQDPQLRQWLEPRLIACRSDADPRVVALADEILGAFPARADGEP